MATLNTADTEPIIVFESPFGGFGTMDVVDDLVLGDGNDDDFPLPPGDGLGFDFGDAPNSYGTLLPLGARHVDFGGFLGAAVDLEPNGQPSPDALGDDAGPVGDDEDGVIFRGPFFAGLLTTVDVTASGDGLLDVWIDWDGNGVFDPPKDMDGNGLIDDPGDFVNPLVLAGGVPFRENLHGGAAFFGHIPVGNGLNRLQFFVPNILRSVPSFARFRYTNDAAVVPSPIGAYPDGEVEDYRVQLIHLLPDFGDAPDSESNPGYPTLLAHDGAVHLVSVADFHLGEKIDVEPDGTPDPLAVGDDEDDGLEFPMDSNPDDEDGIEFLTPLVPGQAAEIVATAKLGVIPTARLDAWVDFNADGDWDDPGEQVLQSEPLVDGANPFSILVPTSAAEGTTFARFRMSRDGGLAPTGVATSGEVEDYAVDIGRPAMVAPTAGDFNADGVIDQADLDFVLLNWGVDVSTIPGVGIGATGLVDQDELDAVLLGWGTSVGGAPPTSPSPLIGEARSVATSPPQSKSSPDAARGPSMRPRFDLDVLDRVFQRI